MASRLPSAADAARTDTAEASGEALSSKFGGVREMSIGAPLIKLYSAAASHPISN